jgi:hypothetical protein
VLASTHLASHIIIGSGPGPAAGGGGGRRGGSLRGRRKSTAGAEPITIRRTRQRRRHQAARVVPPVAAIAQQHGGRTTALVARLTRHTGRIASRTTAAAAAGTVDRRRCICAAKHCWTTPSTPSARSLQKESPSQQGRKLLRAQLGEPAALGGTAAAASSATAASRVAAPPRASTLDRGIPRALLHSSQHSRRTLPSTRSTLAASSGSAARSASTPPGSSSCASASAWVSSTRLSSVAGLHASHLLAAGQGPAGASGAAAGGSKTLGGSWWAAGRPRLVPGSCAGARGAAALPGRQGSQQVTCTLHCPACSRGAAPGSSKGCLGRWLVRTSHRRAAIPAWALQRRSTLGMQAQRGNLPATHRVKVRSAVLRMSPLSPPGSGTPSDRALKPRHTSRSR